jgi:serine/threonine protein kinase
VKGAYDMPSGLSPNTKDFLSKMIVRDPTRRLGSLAGGERDIFVHPFFTGIDFKELRRMAIKAPYVPTIKDPLDAENFEDWSHLEDKSKKKYKSLTKKQEEIFEDF